MIFSFSDCQKPKPDSDSTPPTLKWKVLNKNTNQFVILDEITKSTEAVGKATITAKPGDSFRVTLIADDPEGVHEVSITGSNEGSCSDANVTQKVPGTLEAAQKQPLEPNSEGKVLTSFFLQREIQIEPYQCQPGYTFDGAAYTVFGSAKNFFDGVAKGQLVIKIPAG